MVAVGGAMVVCDVCGQALSSEAAVRRHTQHTPPGRQPRCPLCGAAAPGCDELRRHIEAAHPGLPDARRPELAVGPPECPFCGEVAGQELEAHVRARHGHLLGAPGTGERRRRGASRLSPRGLGLAAAVRVGSGEPSCGTLPVCQGMTARGCLHRAGGVARAPLAQFSPRGMQLESCETARGHQQGAGREGGGGVLLGRGQ